MRIIYQFSRLPDLVNQSSLAKMWGYHKQHVNRSLKQIDFPLSLGGKIIRDDLLSHSDLLPESFVVRIGLMRILDQTRAEDCHEIAKELLETLRDRNLKN